MKDSRSEAKTATIGVRRRATDARKAARTGRHVARSRRGGARSRRVGEDVGSRAGIRVEARENDGDGGRHKPILDRKTKKDTDQDDRRKRENPDQEIGTRLSRAAGPQSRRTNPRYGLRGPRRRRSWGSAPGAARGESDGATARVGSVRLIPCIRMERGLVESMFIA